MIIINTHPDRIANAVQGLNWYMKYLEEFPPEFPDDEVLITTEEPNTPIHLEYGEPVWCFCQDGFTDFYFNAPNDFRSYRGFLSMEACNLEELRNV